MKLRPSEAQCITHKNYLEQLRVQVKTLNHSYLDEKKTMVSKSRLIESGVRVSGSELLYGMRSLITGVLLQVQSIFKDLYCG